MAAYSHGEKAQAVLSGHTPSHRLDDATDGMPVVQLVGGGPNPENATLTVIDAEQKEDRDTLDIRIVDLSGKLLHQKQWSS